MAREHSAGIIIFRRIQDKKLYLLLHYEAGHWGLPKGHVEYGESDTEAALREVTEETSLYNIDIDQNFKEELKYMFHRGDTKILKTVTFFLGETNQEDVEISKEHKDHKWLPFNMAYKMLTFESAKEILNKAEDYLNEKSDENLQFGAEELEEDQSLD